MVFQIKYGGTEQGYTVPKVPQSPIAIVAQ